MITTTVRQGGNGGNLKGKAQARERLSQFKCLKRQLTAVFSGHVAKLVYAAVLKTASGEDCGFESRRAHH
jgi:hypothetical protein